MVEEYILFPHLLEKLKYVDEGTDACCRCSNALWITVTAFSLTAPVSVDPAAPYRFL